MFFYRESDGVAQPVIVLGLLPWRSPPVLAQRVPSFAAATAALWEEALLVRRVLPENQGQNHSSTPVLGRETSTTRLSLL